MCDCAGGKTPDPSKRSYADVIAEARLRAEEVSHYNYLGIHLNAPLSLSLSLQRDVHQAIVDKKADGQLAPAASKSRASKRGRWDMQQTPDVNAPPTKKSAWDEVSLEASRL